MFQKTCLLVTSRPCWTFEDAFFEASCSTSTPPLTAAPSAPTNSPLSPRSSRFHRHTVTAPISPKNSRKRPTTVGFTTIPTEENDIIFRDETLLRFLRARKFDVGKASEMLFEYTK
eukprot:Filipodium_phascolosomae@DN6266_c0_g1_i1.p1